MLSSGGQGKRKSSRFLSGFLSHIEQLEAPVARIFAEFLIVKKAIVQVYANICPIAYIGLGQLSKKVVNTDLNRVLFFSFEIIVGIP